MNPRFIYIALLIFVSALSRLLPHPSEFTPIIAIAIFGGATFTNKRDAIFVPLLAMLISDFFLGFHSLIPIVYSCIAVISLISFYTLKERNLKGIILNSFFGAVFFFLVTNFAVWLSSGMYELNAQGFILCYTLAIPFFKNSLAAVTIYSGLLFGLFTLIEKYILSSRQLETSKKTI